MREVLHLSRDDARRVPWKNGRGATEELALWPRDSRFEQDDFEWRISKAVVDESGPFSMFPGFERILVVLRGDNPRMSPMVIDATHDFAIQGIVLRLVCRDL